MKLKILAFAVALTLATNLSAQTLTTLHNFTPVGAPYPWTVNSDGANPEASLILSDGMLYGTTSSGGSSGEGAIFKVNVDGSGFTNLYSCSITKGNKGNNPYLVLADDILYGTTFYDNFGSYGMVFKIDTNGSSFTILYSFPGGTNGANPAAGLTLSGNILYGTTDGGGSAGYGTVFAVNTDGTGFTNLHTFIGYTNEGANPYSGLVLQSNTLYGTTFNGGVFGKGTVFMVRTDGSGFTNLHSFTTTVNNSSGLPINKDGAYPQAGLVISNSNLYGTTYWGGDQGAGTIFRIGTDGTGFTNLHSFALTGNVTMGIYSQAGLIISGNNLYGTTDLGGDSGVGAVFTLNTDGTCFTNLHSFTPTVNNGYGIYTNMDGAYPKASLTLSDNILYGTTFAGGSGGVGTVFALSLAPSAPVITIQPQGQMIQSGSNVSFAVTADGSMPLNYQWQFNGQNLAGQTAASLSLTNVQFANAGGYSVIVTNAYGSTNSAVAQLTVFTNLVVAQTNEPPPPPGNPTIPTDPTQFRVFTNGGFVTGIGLDPSKSTIVITHGWNDSSGGWPLEMANNIKLVLGASTPNIVAWDWTTVAAEPLPAATLDTQGQGYALGEDLAAALGPNYSQRIHFIGHSLGTLVNARAANYIHANGFAWSNTQMTLFDDAEVAWGLVGNSWATLTSLLQNDSSPQPDWIQPLPDQCAWADNYITAVGMPHPLAVNVILTNLAPDLSNIQNLFDFSIGAWTGQFKTEITDYHDYPYIWYFNTVNQINNPNDPPYLMGFSRSWEGGGSAGRPATNSYYIESTDCPPSFPSYSGYDPAYNLVQITPDQANQYLNARPQNLISHVGVNLVSSSANILANNNNQQVQLLNGPAVNVSSLVTGPYNAFETALATEVELVTTSLINGGGLVRPFGGPVPFGRKRREFSGVCLDTRHGAYQCLDDGVQL